METNNTVELARKDTEVAVLKNRVVQIADVLNDLMQWCDMSPSCKSALLRIHADLVGSL